MTDKFPKQLLGTGVSAPKEFDQLKSVVNAALKSGIWGFDTAPSYNSEKMLSEVLRESLLEMNLEREDIFVQTKIDAWQMQKGEKEIKFSVEKMLNEMKMDYIDSLLIHWPVPEYLDDTWKSFVDMRKGKMVKHIGVCNVRMRQLLKFMENDYIPEIVQIERNPLLTFMDEVDFCQKNNIEVQAYSPLCKMNEKISSSEFLMELSKKYRKSIGQIVLRWHIDTDVSPVFTSTKPERIKEYSEIFDFHLNNDEIDRINSLNINYKMYLEAWSCPGF